MNTTVKSLDQVRQHARVHNVIPLYREIMGDLETPITLLQKIKQSVQSCFLLESVALGEKHSRFSFLGFDPIYIFESRGKKINLSGKENRTFEGDPLPELRKFLERFNGLHDPKLPAFAGGAVGFVCYDSIRLIEKIPDTGIDNYQLPEIHFGIYDAFFGFDRVQQKLMLVANVLVDEFPSLECAYDHAIHRLDELELILQRERSSKPSNRYPSPKWKSNRTQEEFEHGVRTCQKYIEAGDCFQIVYSQRFECQLEVEPIDVYRALRQVNPSPYMYYLQNSEIEVVGASPETLVKVDQRRVETYPVAGTRPRGRTEEEDLALEKDLLADKKEIAEHVMLVDLGRNDLGRVSTFGSVHPVELMVIDRLSHVMHISSRVTGELKAEIHCLDALMACLPAGTLSGAPKIRAMEIIDELETHKRGIYGGAICYLDFRGNLDSCIAIRTMVFQQGTAYVQAGAGIVADSKPKMEYEETKHKAQAMMQAIELACQI